MQRPCSLDMMNSKTYFIIDKYNEARYFDWQTIFDINFLGGQYLIYEIIFWSYLPRSSFWDIFKSLTINQDRLSEIKSSLNSMINLYSQLINSVHSHDTDRLPLGSSKPVSTINLYILPTYVVFILPGLETLLCSCNLFESTWLWTIYLRVCLLLQFFNNFQL